MQQQKEISLGQYKIGNHQPFTLLAGPCQMESREHAFDMAGRLKEICGKLGIQLVYKSSFDKANRTSIGTQRGIGLSKALDIFADIKKEFSLPIVTDIHEAHQCMEVAEVADILQIPAFLCRQTDLLVAAGQTGKIINVKKGQFLAPEDMEHVAKKISSTGNDNIMLCDRGTSFGYHMLVSDMRAIPIMANTGYPVVFDATHSVQMPGGLGGSSGGKREFVPILARAALSIGIAALFIETHEDPDNAPSDGPNMVKIQELPELLKQFVQLDQFAKAHPAY
ncbi:MAG: 3-deoxy-8-phosphooctulonate synthase [Alphaproteobacteria bacterium]